MGKINYEREFLRSRNSQVAGSQSSRSPLTAHFLGSLQQSLGKQLQRPGDDDGDRGGHLPHLVVALHDLLDPSLEIRGLITIGLYYKFQ